MVYVLLEASMLVVTVFSQENKMQDGAYHLDVLQQTKTGA